MRNTEKLLTHELQAGEAFPHSQHRPLHGHFSHRSQALLTNLKIDPNGSLKRSSCPGRPIRPLWSPCSPTASWAHRKRIALGQWGFTPNPLTQQKMGPAPMPVVFCWGGTDPCCQGIGYSVCTVSGGHGARDRKEHKRWGGAKSRQRQGPCKTSHQELRGFSSLRCTVFFLARFLTWF